MIRSRVTVRAQTSAARRAEHTDDGTHWRPRIRQALKRVDRLRHDMQTNQAEIDRLKSETRAILAQLQGT